MSLDKARTADFPAFRKSFLQIHDSDPSFRDPLTGECLIHIAAKVFAAFLMIFREMI
jgi:hypothetical protein